jgi:hypothetical protein
MVVQLESTSNGALVMNVPKQVQPVIRGGPPTLQSPDATVVGQSAKPPAKWECKQQGTGKTLRCRLKGVTNWIDIMDFEDADVVP